MSRLALLAILTTLTLPLVIAGSAHAGTWEIDASHSSVGFKVRHLMVSWVPGTFDRVSGTVDFDPADPLSLKADVTIDAASIDTGHEKRDRHLRNEDFLDVEKFPTIRFVSRVARARPDGAVELVGDLTLLTVSREVVLLVEGPVSPVKSPWGGRKSGVSATTKFKRSDFGITWNKLMETGDLVVGDEIHVAIELELNEPKDNK